MIGELAQFRYRLRRFLRFSEKAARAAGVTPQQHQLMLGVAGFTGRGWATISELREFLQERHNAVVALVNRAVHAKLVRKMQVAHDRRFVRVDLTVAGRATLTKLAALHRRELSRFHNDLETALLSSPKDERENEPTSDSGAHKEQGVQKTKRGRILKKIP
jgi:DNA-binding MarR family transcriptional regulator